MCTAPEELFFFKKCLYYITASAVSHPPGCFYEAFLLWAVGELRVHQSARGRIHKSCRSISMVPTVSLPCVGGTVQCSVCPFVDACEAFCKTFNPRGESKVCNNVQQSQPRCHIIHMRKGDVGPSHLPFFLFVFLLLAACHVFLSFCSLIFPGMSSLATKSWLPCCLPCYDACF